MKPAPVALAAAALVLVACSSHVPRLDIERANRQRGIVSSRTPTQKERSIEASVGDEVRSFAKAAKKAAPGETIEVKLGPGVYVIDEPVVVRGVKLVIAGSGVDRTRLKLDSDDWRALSVYGCPDFELRGVTVAAYSGGGIDVHDCARVVVNECDFVGARYGLELDSSTAVIDSCVFAGNEKGLLLGGTGTTLVRGSTFAENWWSIAGSGKLEALGCAFIGNEKGADVVFAPHSTLRSTLIARGETFQGGGRPSFESSLIGMDDLLEQQKKPLSDFDNRPIGEWQEFPNALPLGLPPSCDAGAIHYAIERWRRRGSGDLEAKLDDVLRTEAEFYAQGARRAVAAKNAPAARELARLAHTYLLALSPAASRAGFEDVEALVSVSQ